MKVSLKDFAMRRRKQREEEREERERVRGSKEEGEEEEREEHQKWLKMLKIIEATIGEENAGRLLYEDGGILSTGGTPPLPP